MTGIGDLTPDQIRQRLLSFNPSYVEDWNQWLTVRHSYPLDHAAPEFAHIIRKWNACRPNPVRRCRDEDAHGSPYIDDLFNHGIEVCVVLRNFDLRQTDSINDNTTKALCQLWKIFKDLSYRGTGRKNCRNGKAGVVGISKGVLLLTEGRVGPAFDSEVRKALEIGDILTAENWIDTLRWVIQDVSRFERLNHCSLKEVAPDAFRSFHYGRLYDMVFGPRAKQSELRKR